MSIYLDMARAEFDRIIGDCPNPTLYATEEEWMMEILRRRNERERKIVERALELEEADRLQAIRAHGRTENVFQYTQEAYGQNLQDYGKKEY